MNVVSPDRILFYDGYCAMCNQWVRWVKLMDRSGRVHFAPLSGQTAGELLSSVFPDYSAMSTLVYYREGKVFTKSRAVLEVVKDCGLPFSVGYLGIIVPGFIRDGIYNWVAANRFRLYKKLESCPVPPASWRKRFLP